MTIFEIIRNRVDRLQSQNQQYDDEVATRMLFEEPHYGELRILVTLQIIPSIDSTELDDTIRRALNSYLDALTQRRVREIRTAHAIDQRNGHILFNAENEDGCFGRYIEYLSRKWNDADAVSRLVEECSTIFGHFPIQTARQDRLGMVIGQVQSGKTSCFNGLIAAGVDYGFNFIIVLSGQKENLRRQTQRRLQKDIIEVCNQIHEFREITVPEQAGLINKVPNNVFANLNGPARPIVYAVILKNSRVLTNLIRFINSASQTLRQHINALIIDDECDEATPNMAAATATPSPINNRIRSLRQSLNECCYIGFTATPFANLLNESGEGTLYPRDFIHFLPTPPKYFGPEQLFGDPDEEESEETIIPLNIIRILNQQDIESLVPQRGINYEPQRCEGLIKSIAWFITASASRAAKGDRDFSTMLIHTTPSIHQQRSLAQLIRRIIDSYKNDYEQLIRDCLSIWNEEYNIVDNLTFSRAFPNYGSEIGLLPEWEQVENEIQGVINNVEVRLDNSDSSEAERIDYSENAPKIQIAVGGNTLSRGLTLEGLICSLFARRASNYDTLLQMGRWFGYRIRYEHLPRIWTTADLRDGFRNLVTMEKHLRQDILEKYISQNNTPSQIAPKILVRPEFAITRRGAMRSARQINIDYSGTSPQTINFLNNEEILRSNWLAGEELLRTLFQEQYQNIQPLNTGRLIIDVVPQYLVVQFLESYEDYDRRRYNKELIIRFINKNQNNYDFWRVVVAGKLGGPPWETSFGDVGKINRSRLKNDKNDNGEFVENINIKALMSSTDLLIDGPNLFQPSQKRDVRWQLRADNNLPPLLILYPINRDSQPQNVDDSIPPEKQERTRLGALHDILGVAIVFNANGDEDDNEYLQLTPQYNLPDSDLDAEEYQSDIANTNE